MNERIKITAEKRLSKQSAFILLFNRKQPFVN